MAINKKPEERESGDITTILSQLQELKYDLLLKKIRPSFFNDTFARLLKGRAFQCNKIAIEKNTSKKSELLLFLIGEIQKMDGIEMTLDPKIDNVEVINRGAIFGNINWVKFGMKHALRESEKDPQLKSVGRIGLVADLELEEHDDYYFERVWLGDKEYKKDRNLYEQYQKNYVCSKTCFMGYLDQKDLKKVVLRSKEIEKSLNMMFL